MALFHLEGSSTCKRPMASSLRNRANRDALRLAVVGATLLSCQARFLEDLLAKGQARLELSAPTDGGVIAGEELRLSWQLVPGATYHLVVSKDPRLSRPILDRTGIRDASTICRGFSAGTYYWQVTAQRGGSDIATSRIYSLTIGPERGR